MNYTRRTWLTAAGALGFGTALTRCGGGGDPLTSESGAASPPRWPRRRPNRERPPWPLPSPPGGSSSWAAAWPAWRPPST